MRFRKSGVKLEHHLISGLRPVLDLIAAQPGVKALIPGVIAPCGGGASSVRRTTDTPAGFKLLAKHGGSVQEVFVVCAAGADRESVWLAILAALPPSLRAQGGRG